MATMIWLALAAASASPAIDLPPGRPIPYPRAVARRLAQPRRIDQHPAPVPAAARAAGHLGKVAVEVSYSPAGAITDARLVESSQSPLLDAAALDAARASAVVPGVDAVGNATGGKVKLVYSFDDRAAASYRCDQAVRDWSWWHATSPTTPYYFRDLLWETLSGERAYSLLSKQSWRSDAKAWEKAIKQCARTPDALFVPTAQRAGIVVPQRGSRPAAAGNAAP